MQSHRRLVKFNKSKMRKKEDSAISNTEEHTVKINAGHTMSLERELKHLERSRHLWLREYEFEEKTVKEKFKKFERRQSELGSKKRQSLDQVKCRPANTKQKDNSDSFFITGV